MEYDVSFSHTPNDVDAFSFNHNFFLDTPSTQFDFVADSSQLDWVAVYTQSGNLANVPEAFSLALLHETSPDVYEQVESGKIFAPSTQAAQAVYSLQSGDKYRMRIESAFGAGGQFGPNNQYSYDFEFDFTTTPLSENLAVPEPAGLALLLTAAPALLMTWRRRRGRRPISRNIATISTF